MEGRKTRLECIATKSFYRVAKKVKPKKTNPIVINILQLLCLDV